MKCKVTVAFAHEHRLAAVLAADPVGIGASALWAKPSATAGVPVFEWLSRQAASRYALLEFLVRIASLPRVSSVTPYV